MVFKGKEFLSSADRFLRREVSKEKKSKGKNAREVNIRKEKEDKFGCGGRFRLTRHFLPVPKVIS